MQFLSVHDMTLRDIIFGNEGRSSGLPRYASAPIPLVNLGDGAVTVLMTVSSPSHVGVVLNVFPSFSVPQLGASGVPPLLLVWYHRRRASQTRGLNSLVSNLHLVLSSRVVRYLVH